MGLELAKLWVRVRADDTGMQKDLQQTHKTVQSAGLSMSSVLKGAMAGAGALGAGLVMKHGLELASNLEQTTVAFQTMLGSASAAQKMLADLQQFAASTPFQLPGIQEAAKVLLAFGVTQEEMMPTLKALGDISAGTGKDFKELSVIFGQIKAKGRLMGGELLQLSEAGVPIVRVLAEQFGVAESEISKMSESGKIGFKEVEKALFAMSQEGGQFNNLMEKQSKTVGGLYSTLKDNIDAVLTKIFTALAPVTKAVLEMAGGMVESFSTAFESMSDQLIQWGLNAADWMRVVKDNFGTVWELVKTQFAFQLSSMWDYLTNFFQAVPKIANAAFEAMKDIVRGYFDLFKHDLTSMKNLFMLVFQEMENIWLSLFTGDSISTAIQKANERVAKEMMSAATRRAQIATEAAVRAGLEIGEGLKDLNFSAASEGTKLLEQERDRLANVLGKAKSELEQQRQAEIRKQAAADAAAAVTTKPTAIAASEKQKRELGFVGFAEIAQKIQDSLFKKDDDQQQKMVSLLEKSNTIQQQQLNEMKSPTVVAGVLS